MVFPWFLGLRGPPESLPGALLAATGAVLAALGRLLGRPGWSWVALVASWALMGRAKWVLGGFWMAPGGALSPRNYEGSENHKPFIV